MGKTFGISFTKKDLHTLLGLKEGEFIGGIETWDFGRFWAIEVHSESRGIEVDDFRNIPLIKFSEWVVKKKENEV